MELSNNNNIDKERLKETLDRLADCYNSEDFIESDPISVPHSFSSAEDIEIAGFLSATIAWGNRKMIVTNCNRMMKLMDRDPYRFVCEASERELLGLSSFVHRTFNGEDLIFFVRSLRRMYQSYGGLGGYFQDRFEHSGDIRTVLADFRGVFFEEDHPERAEKHLSSIEKKAACKRLCMFLRWMVRRDDRGVDFGLWERIPASALYLPLDVHSGNEARRVGLLTRVQNDWPAVEEITQQLREMDPEDPVKYDFALFGAGINKGMI